MNSVIAKRTELIKRLRWQEAGWDFPGEDVHAQIGEARKLFREAADALEEAERTLSGVVVTLDGWRLMIGTIGLHVAQLEKEIDDDRLVALEGWRPPYARASRTDGKEST